MPLPHETCSICKHIPDVSHSYYKYGHDEYSSNFPKQEQALEIVGAPYFNDSTSGSNHCLKRCPKCGTFYAWDHTYEFLVNGSEDDTTLTRLDQNEGEKRAAKILKTIRESETAFQSRLSNAIKGLRRLNDPNQFIGGLNVIIEGNVRGNDNSPAIPALVAALVKLPRHGGFQSALSSLWIALEAIAKRDSDNASKILTALEQHKPLQEDQYVRWVRECSEKQLQ